MFRGVRLGLWERKWSYCVAGLLTVDEERGDLHLGLASFLFPPLTAKLPPARVPAKQQRGRKNSLEKKDGKPKKRSLYDVPSLLLIFIGVL